MSAEMRRPRPFTPWPVRPKPEEPKSSVSTDRDLMIDRPTGIVEAYIPDESLKPIVLTVQDILANSAQFAHTCRGFIPDEPILTFEQQEAELRREHDQKVAAQMYGGQE